jgi:DNA repair protein RecN (Recombination protein N)
MESLEQAKSVLDEAVYDLRQYVSKIEADPEKLENMESRLSDLRKLQKKYGSSVDDILKALLDIETEIAQLANSESRIEDLKKEASQLRKELETLGTDIHKRRLKGSEILAESVNAELSELNMKGVTFHVHVEKLSELSATGLSDVEFMSQTSAKDVKRPLAKFASGGELSRILLSLKRVVGSSHQPRTYLFDEVDTGVSGETAEKVGKKLKSIAKGQQVICVTHLSQVAAFGDVHFFIQKSSQKGHVAMEVVELNAKERVQEIARLISGEKITKTSLAHAQELLEEAAGV